MLLPSWPSIALVLGCCAVIFSPRSCVLSCREISGLGSSQNTHNAHTNTHTHTHTHDAHEATDRNTPDTGDEIYLDIDVTLHARVCFEVLTRPPICSLSFIREQSTGNCTVSASIRVLLFTSSGVGLV